MIRKNIGGLEVIIPEDLDRIETFVIYNSRIQGKPVKGNKINQDTAKTTNLGDFMLVGTRTSVKKYIEYLATIDWSAFKFRWESKDSYSSKTLNGTIINYSFEPHFDKELSIKGIVIPKN